MRLKIGALAKVFHCRLPPVCHLFRLRNILLLFPVR